MEYIYEYGLFLAQAITFVAAILLVVSGMVALGQRQKSEQHEGHIEVRDINEKYRNIRDHINHMVAEPAVLKAQNKAEKKAEKARAKAEKKKRGKGSPTTRSGAKGCTYLISTATSRPARLTTCGRKFPRYCRRC